MKREYFSHIAKLMNTKRTKQNDLYCTESLLGFWPRDVEMGCNRILGGKVVMLTDQRHRVKWGVSV